jgi:hypothetical protein
MMGFYANFVASLLPSSLVVDAKPDAIARANVKNETGRNINMSVEVRTTKIHQLHLEESDQTASPSKNGNSK